MQKKKSSHSNHHLKTGCCNIFNVKIVKEFCFIQSFCEIWNKPWVNLSLIWVSGTFNTALNTKKSCFKADISGAALGDIFSKHIYRDCQNIYISAPNLAFLNSHSFTISFPFKWPKMTNQWINKEFLINHYNICY